MKKTVVLFLVTMLFSSVTMAQDAAIKERMAHIRKCYAEAQKLANEGMNGAKKNYLHLDQHTTGTDDYSLRTVDFFFVNEPDVSGRQPYRLVLAREKCGITVCEYLYDKNNSQLMFYFKKTMGDYDDETKEIRSYYPADDQGDIWTIVRRLDRKDGKVIEELAETDNSGPSQAYRMDASYLLDAFDLLTIQD